MISPHRKALAETALAIPETSSVIENYGGKKLTTVTVVEVCSYKDYRKFRRAGEIEAEVVRDGWIFFAVSDTYDIWINEENRFMLTVTLRYKTNRNQK